MCINHRFFFQNHHFLNQKIFCYTTGVRVVLMANNVKRHLKDVLAALACTVENAKISAQA